MNSEHVSDKKHCRVISKELVSGCVGDHCQGSVYFDKAQRMLPRFEKVKD